MTDEPSAKNATTFRIALLAMLLSIWLIGRAGQRQDAEQTPDDVATLEKPERRDPVTTPVAPPVEVDANTPGRVEGIVKFVGKKWETVPLVIANDPYCANLYAGRESLLQERSVLGENDTVQNVLIHVTAGLPEREWQAPGETAVIRLHECRIQPHVTAMQFGQLVEVHNLDPILHVPSIIPSASAGVEASLGAQSLPMVWMPQKSEIGVYFKSNTKAWMNGYIHIIDHPFFDVTGPQGTYEINDLPPGEYELSLWHELKVFRDNVKPVKVKIEPGKTTKIDFTIEQKSKTIE